MASFSTNVCTARFNRRADKSCILAPAKHVSIKSSTLHTSSGCGRCGATKPAAAAAPAAEAEASGRVYRTRRRKNSRKSFGLAIKFTNCCPQRCTLMVEKLVYSTCREKIHLVKQGKSNCGVKFFCLVLMPTLRRMSGSIFCPSLRRVLIFASISCTFYKYFLAAPPYITLCKQRKLGIPYQ